MSDYTIDDNMAKLIYEISDREIYNDIRAEIGVQHSETVVDADPTYSWRQWYRYSGLGNPGTCYSTTYNGEYQAISWQIINASSDDHDYNPYYDYTINIVESDSDHCVVKWCNTGSKGATIGFTLRYKYQTSEGTTHDEIAYQTLTVRATDDTSIAKYGRRVMNLTWPQGTTANDMQGICNTCLARYKDPVPNIMSTIKGTDDTIASEIFTREISDTISVVCDNLGLASTDFYLDSISIRDSALKQPTCNWLLTGQRTAEVTDWFRFGSGHFGGPEVLG